MHPESAPALTKRQQECLDVIRNHLAETGVPPTVRFIATALGIASVYGVICHLRALQRKGYIKRGKNQARAIALTSRSCWSLPYGGTIE